MNKKLLFWFAAIGMLVTGCPRNQYIVELTPHGKVLERRLIFYREDGADNDGVPNYKRFPDDELAMIRKLYPAESITRGGDRYTALGQFADAMPPDVGGAGRYTNVSTELGSSGFYMERFRGDDDLAGRIAKRSRVADELADLVIGWSGQQFGSEPNYKELHRFLDTEFRRDLKNLGFYGWMVQASNLTKPQNPEEFGVRFGQYLVERHYLNMEDVPALFRTITNGDEQPLMGILQRLLKDKLGLPKSGPMPASLAALADPAVAVESWNKYLRTTDQYQAKLRQWEKRAETSANPAKPDPSDFVQELAMELLDFSLWNTDDHVTVRLSLPSAPDRSNGKWDQAHKQVSWESDLETGTNTVTLPVFCYASWSEANEPFQKEHFGKVVLRGEGLTQYCLWRAGLDQKLAAEWEAFLSGLRPGEQLTEALEDFRFSEEPAAAGLNHQRRRSDLPRGLIQEGLDAEGKKGGK